MGISRRYKTTWPMRGKVRSPGAPSLPRERRVRFWEAIGRGLSSDEAHLLQA